MLQHNKKRTASVSIDLAAAAHNLQLCLQRSTSQQLMPVLKANAYGHGALQMLPVYKNLALIAVAQVDEAVELCRDFAGQIVVLQGFQDVEQLQTCLHYNFIPVVHSWQQLAIMAAHLPAHFSQVWLKMNSGMNRIGFMAADFATAYQRLQELDVSPNIVAITHMASGDEIEILDNNARLKLQQQQFYRYLPADEPIEKSVANSACFLRRDTKKCNYARLGIALYGVNPFAATLAELAAASDYIDVDFVAALKPVMTLKSKIIAIHDYRKGQQIGYGAGYTLERDSKIAVLAIGYGDGYPRAFQRSAEVLVQGKRCKVVGRISMDMLSIDVSAVATVEIGDEAILWGKGLPVEEVAAAAGSIAYELLCQVSRRLDWQYTHLTA